MQERTKIPNDLFKLICIILILTGSCKKDTDENRIETGSLTDVEGNVYKTVKIGNQWWMAENLKTTKYKDGSSIPLVTNDTVWANLITPGFCYYNNDTANKKTYGTLYNWYSVNTGKLAPEGWHIPTDAEWTTLTNNLGGENVAGMKMKSPGTIEAGTGLWHSANTWVSNESGFTAVPGGYRLFGSFDGIGYAGFFWSSTDAGTSSSWGWHLSYGGYDVVRASDEKKTGLSVRCLQDF